MRRVTLILILTMMSATLAHGQTPAKKAAPMTRAEKRMVLAARDRREAAAQAAAMAKAEAQYKAMLPYLMEQQRQELERQSAIERNMALHRMAGAQEAQAQATRRQADNAAYYLYYNRPR